MDVATADGPVDACLLRVCACALDIEPTAFVFGMARVGWKRFRVICHGTFFCCPVGAHVGRLTRRDHGLCSLSCTTNRPVVFARNWGGGNGLMGFLDFGRHAG